MCHHTFNCVRTTNYLAYECGKHVLVILTDMSEDGELLYLICQAMDEEKDQECLKLSFHLVEVFMKLFPNLSGFKGMCHVPLIHEARKIGTMLLLQQAGLAADLRGRSPFLCMDAFEGLQEMPSSRMTPAQPRIEGVAGN